MEQYPVACEGFCCLQCVRQNEVGVVEDLGQFKRLLPPGLHLVCWPLQGIAFAPDAMIGTSNEVSAADVRLAFDADRMLVIVPVTALPAVLRGLGLLSGAHAK